MFYIGEFIVRFIILQNDNFGYFFGKYMMFPNLTPHFNLGSLNQFLFGGYFLFIYLIRLYANQTKLWFKYIWFNLN